MMIISQNDLIKGAYYTGIFGRFSGKTKDGRDVAMWNGKHFIGIGYSFGDYQIDFADYGERGFEPLSEI